MAQGHSSMKRTFACAMLMAAMGMAVAARAEHARATPPQAHNGQSQGYFGVDLRDVSEDEVPALKLKDTHGAEVILVDHDAPAGKAGLHEHDVVLEMNGQPIAGQEQIRRMLHECPAGHPVVLVISRDGQQMTLTSRMSTREEVEREAWAQHVTVADPQQEAARTNDSASSPPAASPGTSGPLHMGNSFMGSILMNSTYTGAILEQLSSQLAQFFGVANGSGLLVRSVADNSPAASAGMRAGDVVVRADERPINTTGDWAKTIKNSRGRPVSVVVLRDKQEHRLTLTPDPHHRSSIEDLFVSPERSVVAYLNVLRVQLP
jgi:serine protease Do